MSNAKQLFNKILVNNVEIDIDELDANNGQYQLPAGETQATVKFELKDNTTIPTNVFNNNPQIKSVKLASTINTIEDGAFEGTYLDAESIAAIQEINPIAYIAYTTNNTGTLDVDYQVGYKYTLPLMYTERSGQRRIQEIGTAKVQIVEIDNEEESTSQYKLKIKVIQVNITNPLSDVNIDYSEEIINKYFYTQETFITADMEMFMSLPGFTGVESFFAMKGEGDTYHPELENFSGVTDYSIKRNTLELNPEID